MSLVAGPAALALSSLSQTQLSFIKTLPKAELHAHLNGCVPISALRELAKAYNVPISPDTTTLNNAQIAGGINNLENFDLDDIHGFFAAFGTIYALIATRDALAEATRAVLVQFLGPSSPSFDSESECTYLELRTTPRTTQTLSVEEYLDNVLAEVERYPSNRAALILSLDRRMPLSATGDGKPAIQDVVEIAIRLKQAGRRVVGLDLCGDPLAGDMSLLEPSLAKAKAAGLGLTLHIAETTANTPAETLQLLSYSPDRLGHATFLDEEAKDIVLNMKMAIEICLSSNLICKTVPSLSAHHIRFYLERNHPIAICTDDTLPFRTSLTAEYALLFAQEPLGLGLSEAEVRKIAAGSLDVAFNPDVGSR
ncbi:hypothetical protein BDP27DRAFT_1317224 [Rhodocollybia butyracea]|uniref:Adenosine deaminase domain-containing protein n=1 Tax=Rhodocollybia butyracea TaxID=206335 RepID=A0A9P5UCU7_9AGAR|nr:hypothetical protein BDP27DRAFT_1317224 [Rhodocollybia butyracea]